MRGVLLAFAFVVGISTAAKAEEECQLVKIASLPMSEDPYGRPVVPVTINGTARKFLVDTGGVFSAIGSAAVKELGLRPLEIGSHEIYSASGKKITRFVTVQTMAFGSSIAEYAHLMVLDAGDGVDGIIGPDYLHNFDLDFDFDMHTLNLFSPEHCKGKVVYWTQSYVDLPFRLSESRHITTPMVLDGQKVLAMLDTGASNTFFSMNAARYKFGVKEDAADLEPLPGTDEKSDVRFRRRFGVLSIEGLTVKNPLIYLHDDAAERAFRRNHDVKIQFDPQIRAKMETEELMVGMNILSKLHLYIAYKERMLYVSAANAH
jgi:predicted aspartyl protease